VNINRRAALIATLPVLALAGFLVLVSFYPLAGGLVGIVVTGGILFYVIFNMMKEQLTYAEETKRLEKEAEASAQRLRQALEKLRTRAERHE
jgi:hypothetical protein